MEDASLVVLQSSKMIYWNNSKIEFPDVLPVRLRSEMVHNLFRKLAKELTRICRNTTEKHYSSVSQLIILPQGGRLNKF